MIPKRLEEITKEDILSLVDNGVFERKDLEYKQQLPRKTDDGRNRKNGEDDKYDFLKIVSSLANSAGGDVVYGVPADRPTRNTISGKPSQPLPITDESPDEAIRRLTSTARTGIRPPLSIDCHPVVFDDDGYVLVVRVRQSPNAPHMLTAGDRFEFWARGPADRHRVDLQELRDLFLATETQAERIRQFRLDRIAKIIANETPMRLRSDDRLVIHLIPIMPFLNRHRLNLYNKEHLELFPPIIHIDPRLPNARQWYGRRNLDGHVSYTSLEGENRECESYCQLFSDGTIEAVVANIVEPRTFWDTRYKTIDPRDLEPLLVSSVDAYLKAWQQHDISPPIIISLCFLGCKGVHLLLQGLFSRLLTNPISLHPLDRDVAILPDLVVEEQEGSAADFMRPSFDAIWQVFDLDRSLNYDENGQWKHRADS